MNYRKLGNTGIDVSEVSLGTWQVGGRWGEPFDEKRAERIVHTAIDMGVNFIDTADVYSDGLSERVVAKVVKSRSEDVTIATKSGRRLQPHTADAYTPDAITRFIEDSLRNMELESLDLLQLHCPPTAAYQNDALFARLDALKAQGKIRHYGVSVEKVSEALRAITYPGVETVQIIFNMFRLRPAEEFFAGIPSIQGEPRVGVLARVPLASGLLGGRMSAKTTFGAGDHRLFNRQGEAFDKGETFSGVDFAQGLAAVDELKALFGVDETLYQYAIRWILMFPEVSCVIPGASRPAQVAGNVTAAALPPLTAQQMQGVKDIYDRFFRREIHPQW